MTIPARPYRMTHSDARTTAHIERARELRHTPTEAEEAAWFLLRRLRLKGFKFRRQHPVGSVYYRFLLPTAPVGCGTGWKCAWEAGAEEGCAPRLVPEIFGVCHSAGSQWHGFGSAGNVCEQGARRRRVIARSVWGVKRVRFLTPSPVSPRLVKTPDASHPLPKGARAGGRVSRPPNAESLVLSPKGPKLEILEGTSR